MSGRHRWVHCHADKAAIFILLSCMVLATLARPARAYPLYSTNRTNQCAACHGSMSTSAGNYASLHDGVAWGTNLMNGHATNMLSSDCNACHSASGFFPVFLDGSAGGTGFPVIGCMGCHGRSGDSRDPVGGYGAGLRRHHDRAGISVCRGCHADAATTSSYTPVAESVLPPYYFSPDTNHTTKPANPCDANGSESVFGTTGLDNDGNGLYDLADPACAAAATATPTSTSTPAPPAATRTPVLPTATRPPATATQTSVLPTNTSTPVPPTSTGTRAPATATPNATATRTNTPIPATRPAATATATRPPAIATATRRAATPTTTRPSVTATPASGSALYTANCQSCHGDPRSVGPGPGGTRKVSGARICSINGAINGTSIYPGGVSSMQFLKGRLSAPQLQAISTFLNSFPVTGQQRYITACAGCHGLDASGGRVHKDVKGDDPRKIAEAIADKPTMRFLSCLPGSDVSKIGVYLSSLGGGEDEDDD